MTTCEVGSLLKYKVVIYIHVFFNDKQKECQPRVMSVNHWHNTTMLKPDQ